MNANRSASQRLARSRSQIVQWMDVDQNRREEFSRSGLGQITSLPWLRSITNHPLASLAAGLISKWWMKPRKARSSTVRVLALGTGLGLLRRRPVLTLLTAATLGAAAWWTYFRHRP